jgi:hypothetical protein
MVKKTWLTALCLVCGPVVVLWSGRADADEFKVNCRLGRFKSNSSLRGLLSWGSTYKKRVIKNSKVGRYSARNCKKAIDYYGKARCKAPRDRNVYNQLRQIQRLCRALKNKKARARVMARRARNSGQPRDPTRLNCKHGWFYSANSARSLLSWGRTYAKQAANHDSPGSYPIRACLKALKNYGAATCKARGDRSAGQAWQQTARICRAWFRRARLYKKAKAAGKKIPVAAYSPRQAKKHVKNRLRWARTYSRQGAKGALKAMAALQEALRFDPSNRRAVKLHDSIYASYFGVSQAVARKNRLKGMPEGRLSRMPRARLYKLAIDELLGKHHSVSGNTPKLGLSYLDVRYLVLHVYEKEIRRNMNKFAKLKCSARLRRKRRDFRDAAVEKEMGRKLCRKRDLEIKPREILSDHRMRMKLIQILAQKVAKPAAVTRAAALTVARQVGAPRTKVCWLYENPYPEKHKPTAGKNAHCNAWGKDKGNNTRIGYFNFVYARHPIAKKTKLQIWEARNLLSMVGAANSPLDRKLKRAYRRARGHICVAFSVQLQRPRKSLRSYGKKRYYSVGDNRKVSCRRVRKNRGIMRVWPKSWNNFFDTVIGAKWTGRWRKVMGWWKYRRRRRMRMRRMPIRKVRKAIIYVRRKI